MNRHSSLLPFETMVCLLSQSGYADQLETIIKVKAFTPQESDTKDFELTDECREKLQNTWWEVIWPDRSPRKQPECLYLADSLRDALRLRPGIDLSMWSVSSDSFAHYLAEPQEWFEDAEDMEYAE